MNYLEKCADEEDGKSFYRRSPVIGDAATGKCRPGYRSIGRRYSEIIFSLAIIILTIQQFAMVSCAARPRTTAKPTAKPTALLSEDAFEGRIDTSQLCGTRYSNQVRQNQETSSNNLLYIVGGDEVEDDQFWPWSVAIYELDPLNGHRAFICSGSLISDKFILTAAHCIQQSRFDILTANEVFLKIASVRLDDERSNFYHVESVYVHPEYSVDRKANDIALLKLKHGQRLPPRARPVCLPSHVANRIDFTDQQVTIIGWGKTSAMLGDEPTRLIDLPSSDDRAPIVGDNYIGFDDGSTSHVNDTLLQAEVRVTSTDQCNKNYSKLEISWLNIDEHFICASDPQGKRDACQGDSGGPMMWNNQQGLLEHTTTERWYQLGLVSFGHGCADSQFPGVYTRISYYMPWIVKIVNGRGGAGGSGTGGSISGQRSNNNYFG